MKEKTVDGLRMMVAPLAPLDAIDLGNELVAHLAPGVATAFVNGETLAPFAVLEAIGMTSSAFAGKISAFIPRLVAGTTVVAGESKYDLSKGKDEINRLLSKYPLSLAPLLSFSAEAQFERFFPESVLSAIRAKKESLSKAFSQNIVGTGSSGDQS